MSDEPFDFTNDDDMGEAICDYFAKALVDMARNNPAGFSDLVSGFVSGRLSLLVSKEGVAVHEVEPPDGL